MSTFALEKQTAAACMVHPYEATQILGVRDEARPNGIPSRESLRDQFTFTAHDLHAYIVAAPMRASEIQNRALNNRAIPAPYMKSVNGGFHVGWYNGPPHRFRHVFFHHNIDDAAADFVLTYWGLPRFQGIPVSDSEAAAVFENV